MADTWGRVCRTNAAFRTMGYHTTAATPSGPDGEVVLNFNQTATDIGAMFDNDLNTEHQVGIDSNSDGHPEMYYNYELLQTRWIYGVAVRANERSQASIDQIEILDLSYDEIPGNPKISVTSFNPVDYTVMFDAAINLDGLILKVKNNNLDIQDVEFLTSDQESSSGVNSKIYTNSAWKDADVKVYKNGAWKDAVRKTYKNGGWKS